MASDEASFKAELKESFYTVYSNAVHIWSNTDMFRHGLPDICISYGGRLIVIEAKFIKEIPKRETSKVLGHEVTTSQIEFMNNVERTGNKAMVVICLDGDVAVIMPERKNNYTLAEVRAARRLNKSGKLWLVEGLL